MPIPISVTVNMPILSSKGFDLDLGVIRPYYKRQSDVTYTALPTSSMVHGLLTYSVVLPNLDPNTVYLFHFTLSDSNAPDITVTSDTLTFTTGPVIALTETTILISTDQGKEADIYGWAVDLDQMGTRLAVASLDGGVYSVLRTGTLWSEEQRLVGSDTTGWDGFGYSTGIDSGGDRIIAGSIATTTIGVAGGAAYVFSRAGTTWTEEAKLVASDNVDDNQFGYASAINGTGDIAIIGAPQSTVVANLYQGSAYVFTRTGTSWSQSQQLTASNGLADDFYGTAVAITTSGDRVAIASSSTHHGYSSAGSVYVYRLSTGSWIEEQILLDVNPTGTDQYGRSIALDGTGSILVIGAPAYISGPTDFGRVYIYTRTGTSWTLYTTLSHPTAAGVNFGTAVDISRDGRTIVVGESYAAPVGTALPDTFQAGSIHIYRDVASVWTHDQSILASDIAPEDHYGDSVTLNGDGSVNAVGATNRLVNGHFSLGSVYIQQQP